MAQASVVRPSSIRFSVNSGFSEISAWIHTKFYGKLPIHIFPGYFFLFFIKVWIFEFSHFFFVFFSMWLYGTQNCKRYSSHKSILTFLKLLVIFSLLYPHKVTFPIFELLRFWISMILFFVFLNIGTYSGKFKKNTSSKNCNQTFSNVYLILFSSSWQSYFFRFLKICYFSNFVELWKNLTLESMRNHKMWNILKTADHRVKRIEIWDPQS